MKLRASILALVVASGVASNLAWAGEPTPVEIAKAREEFRRGLSLEVAKDYEGALAVFKSVALVKSTPQVRFHIAVCEENTGDWVGAVGSYRLALEEAREAKVKDVEQESATALAALEPRVPKLTLTRAEGAASAVVSMDGRELGPASVGGAFAVNPGAHHIEATAPGRDRFVADITLKEAESQEVVLVLPAAKDPVNPKITGPIGDQGPRKPSALLPVGIATLALGGAGLVASGVFFGLKQAAISDLDEVCGPDGQSCPESMRETAENGELYSTISLATLIGGAAAVGIGGTLLIVEFVAKPGGRKEAAMPPVRAFVSPTGVSLFGTF